MVFRGVVAVELARIFPITAAADRPQWGRFLWVRRHQSPIGRNDLRP